MSEMQMFVGTFEPAKDQSIFPEDTDDFYEMEQRDGQHYVRVNGKVYAFWPLIDVEPYGFQVALSPDMISHKPLLLCYWYNGGAGLHEVAEQAIEEYLR